MILRLRFWGILALLLLLCICILPGCGTNSTPQPHLLSANDVARQVGTHYGDPHAKIVSLKTTQEDPPPHDTLYLMTISGHFHKNTLQAQTLSFSALATRLYVWGVYAHDSTGTQVWLDLEMMPKT